MEEAEAKIRRLNLWRGTPRLRPLHGGLSNMAFHVEDESGAYVARIGEDFPFHQVSRQREATAARAAFQAGLSPELVHAEPGVMVLRFLNAKTFAEADVRARWRDCVDLVKRGHQQMPKRILGQGAIFWAFQIIRDYCATLQQHNHARAGETARWIKVADDMEAQQVPLPIIFGHHDLLPANFLDDGKRLWLIDWEYGAYGTAMFDLANLAAANSFDANLEHQMLGQYFGHAPDKALLRAFSAMKVAAALREALWAMVSEIFLKAPGADYVAYASENLARFENAFQFHNKENSPI